MIKSHISDGVALTKFIYWIKNVNKKNYCVHAQNKLEQFRKKIKIIFIRVLIQLPAQEKNGAIVHYRAKQENCED